jgi:hypothetical protein
VRREQSEYDGGFVSNRSIAAAPAGKTIRWPARGRREMRRILACVSVVAMLLLLDAPAVRAAGGGNPPNVVVKVAGPTINGTILMDPHTGGQATVFLNKGQGQGTFEFLSGFPVTAGCNDDLVNGTFGNPISRFLFTQANEKNLTDWVPPFVLESLFLPLGISTFPVAPVWPAITQINSAHCLQSPAGAGANGWLLMDVTIQFLVPATK